jgi:hypothetical protein
MHSNETTKAFSNHLRRFDSAFMGDPTSRVILGIRQTDAYSARAVQRSDIPAIHHNNVTIHELCCVLATSASCLERWRPCTRRFTESVHAA